MVQRILFLSPLFHELRDVPPVLHWMRDVLISGSLCLGSPQPHGNIWVLMNMGRYGTRKSVKKPGPLCLLCTTSEEDAIAHILWCAWCSSAGHFWYYASSFIGVSWSRGENLRVQEVWWNVLCTWAEVASAKVDSKWWCGPMLRFPGSKKKAKLHPCLFIWAHFLAFTH